MEIKLLNDTRTIEPTTTEPSKPYLAQKVSGGTEYYPCESYSTGDGVIIKGNGNNYVIKEEPSAIVTLQLINYPDPLSQVKTYDNHNRLQRTYNNPTTSTIIEAFTGGKIEWIHDDSWYWVYRKVGGGFWDNVYVDNGRARSNCFSRVPTDATGLAKLEVGFYASAQHDTFLNFSNYSGSETTGWIQSAYCYPYV